MQNKKALLISLAIALFGTMMVFGYISQLEKKLLEDSIPMKAVVAAKDIPAGTLIDETWLKVVKIPKKYLQPGHLAKIEDAVDKITLIPVLRNSQILETVFFDAASGIASNIPRGQRAFSIPVSEVTAVADLIEPQDFVDILLTAAIGSFIEGKNVTQKIITRTILQNIQVLAVNRSISRASRMASMSGNQSSEGNIINISDTARRRREDAGTLTLAVSPEDAQKLSLAVKLGVLSVSLRYKHDEGQIINIENLDAKDLMEIEEPEFWIPTR